MPRDDSAAYAANWRTVLLIDALIALAGLVVGFAFVSYGNVLGVPLVILGAVYAVLVIRRYRRWLRLRGEAGLQ